METVEDEHSPPPLDTTLAPPVLLFDYGGGGGGEASDAGVVYSVPTRRSLVAPGARRFVHGANWITPHGWVLTVDPGTRGVSLRDPFTSRRVSLPPDPENILAGSDATRCFLSSAPAPPPADDYYHQGSCVVLVVHLKDPVLCYCRPGGSRWFSHEYRPEEIDADDRDGVIGDMASLLVGAGAGTFYAYLSSPSNSLVATLRFSSPDLTLTMKTTGVANRPCPTWCCCTKYCVLESCGELFMVRFCYTRLCGRKVSRVEVQKLDWSESAWVKATGLGDNRVFFVRWGQLGASMAADELGLKENCVYFTLNGDKGLYTYDMEQGTTTQHDPYFYVPDSMEPILLIKPDNGSV